MTHTATQQEAIAFLQRSPLRNIVPLKMFFNPRGRVKVDVALAKGRKLHDKRDNIKSRDWNREKARLLRDKG